MIRFKNICYVYDVPYYEQLHNLGIMVLSIQNYNKNLCSNQNALNKIMWVQHYLNLPFFTDRTYFEGSNFSNLRTFLRLYFICY